MSTGNTPTSRKAWISGASRGIGRSVALQLVADGWEVWGTSRKPDAPGALKDGIREVAFSLSDKPAPLLDHAEKAGGFDLVVNNAGYGLYAPFHVADIAEWERQQEEMIAGSLRVAHQAMTLFRRQGSGTLVNVSSMAAEFPLPFMSGYNVAKAALSALSESLIQETRGSRIVVIDFRPGDIRTEFNEGMKKRAGVDATGESAEARAWRALEKNLQGAPHASVAATDLVKAVRAGRSGIVRSGEFFQTRAAPFFSRLLPQGLKRAFTAHYFGLP